MSMDDFWNCSLWQFAAAVAGWNKAHGGGDDTQTMSEERYEEILQAHGYR